MNEQEIRQLIKKQRTYFQTGATLPVEKRLHVLAKLKAWLESHEAEIGEALCKDLGKSAFESYMTETGLVLSEISYMIKHTPKFAKERRVRTPFEHFAAKCYQKPSPYGVVLIMSPWNYPILLTLDPLVDAIAAGNTAILKPSAYSPNTSALIQTLVKECFDKRLVAVVTGGRAENSVLLGQHFDYIFFTGSQAVGKEVMRQAANHLTPITLELGGKSPCIVDRTANLKLAAKRIVFGKFLNCGQTCVAPDYIYCDRSIREPLIKEITRQIKKQYGKNPLANPDYGKIINDKHFDRLLGLIDSDKVVTGGEVNRGTLQIAPTVMDHVTFGDAIMQEEIFGPILPVLTYDSIDEVIRDLQTLPHPLALYVFSSDHETLKAVTSRIGFGGGCINDTLVHLTISELSFGGFGESGMGAYHGEEGFRTFSHDKSIVDKKTWIDLPMRYQPYRTINDRLSHFFLK